MRCIDIQPNSILYIIHIKKHTQLTHAHAYAHVRTHTHTHILTHTYTHTHLQTHTHAHTQIHTYTYTHTHTHTCTQTHTHAHTHAHTHTHTHTYTHTYLFTESIGSGFQWVAFCIFLFIVLLSQYYWLDIRRHGCMSHRAQIQFSRSILPSSWLQHINF